MHPAYSVIFFTTASGAGYGLLALAGLGAAFGLLPEDRWFGGVSLGLALGLITFGLLASTFHLGHPERAWRAFSQWRTSWLSREGVVSVATYAPALALALGWVVEEDTGGIWAACGIAAALLAAATVWCTGMIYASLPTIHAWSNRFVVPVYLVLALATGALLLTALARLFGADARIAAVIALGASLAGLVLKIAYWRHIDMTGSGSTPETATGLGGIGRVRLLQGPTTLESYVQKEMGYHVARTHAVKLRRASVILLFGLPIPLAAVVLLVAGPAAAIAAVAAVLSAAAGVVIERWLFFAEARHVAMLYYGVERA